MLFNIYCSFETLIALKRRLLGWPLSLSYDSRLFTERLPLETLLDEC